MQKRKAMIANDEKRKVAKALLSEGLSNPAIARRLGVDQSTVFRWRRRWSQQAIQEQETA
ncbi:helix-turn-helix domain-containing protein [Thermoleptolyngbya sp. M55_K2018_002]|uniref:helix-turn-helix domain-containing protein n=1 Tax=Thermoleptolyngbya sp. M55_K2018_002 TaxID=2747808 RepID=UPI001A093FE4|nr:helix-turn-helix domain-containing protein [Thermoleptolyngbya sp. M55_K2018_002]HIK42141.1 helix-turn-helix domain-containing protein [Thermoleptolyngbya sp. M55_K2018_002]